MPISEAQPGPDEGTASEPALERDLYLLAPLTLPRGQQYSVSSSEGQLLFLVRRSAGGRGALALGASSVAGLILLGFISAVGDSLGGPVLKWGAVAAGAVAGFLLAMALYPRLLGSRFVSFGPRERPGEKALEVKQAERSRLFEVSFAVTDARGRLLGTMRRNYLHTILRTRWMLYGAGGELIARAEQMSLARALAGRLVGWAAPAVRSNFVISTPGGAPLALLERRELVQGRVVLDLRQGGREGIERQLGLAVGVLIDVTER